MAGIPAARGESQTMTEAPRRARALSADAMRIPASADTP